MLLLEKPDTRLISRFIHFITFYFPIPNYAKWETWVQTSIIPKAISLLLYNSSTYWATTVLIYLLDQPQVSFLGPRKNSLGLFWAKIESCCETWSQKMILNLLIKNELADRWLTVFAYDWLKLSPPFSLSYSLTLSFHHLDTLSLLSHPHSLSHSHWLILLLLSPFSSLHYSVSISWMLYSLFTFSPISHHYSFTKSLCILLSLSILLLFFFQ